MRGKTYFWVTGFLFLLIAFVHLARILYGWEAIVHGWKVPVEVSMVGLLVAAYLAFMGFRLGRKNSS